MALRKHGREAAYNRAGDDKGPEGSHRVGLDCLKHGHVVFGILCLDGIRLEVVDGSLLRKDDSIVLGLFDMVDSRLGLHIRVAVHAGRLCLPGLGRQAA